MDENEYRQALTAIDPNVCVFEKAVFNPLCECRHAHRFCVAERQGIHCNSDSSRALCASLLDLLRENMRFLAHKTHLAGPLPHAQEARLQIGGLQAVQAAASGIEVSADSQVPDISLTVNEAADQFAQFKTLPLEKVVQHIAQTSPRKS